MGWEIFNIFIYSWQSVYLDCVRRVPKLLKEVVTLMTEKGLRTRLPLEELQVLTETELELEYDEDTTKEEEINQEDLSSEHHEVNN